MKLPNRERMAELETLGYSQEEHCHNKGKGPRDDDQPRSRSVLSI